MPSVIATDPRTGAWFIASRPTRSGRRGRG
jgi:hypothetical protein